MNDTNTTTAESNWYTSDDGPVRIDLGPQHFGDVVALFAVAWACLFLSVPLPGAEWDSVAGLAWVSFLILGGLALAGQAHLMTHNPTPDAGGGA
jgi:hypothetical protein